MGGVLKRGLQLSELDLVDRDAELGGEPLDVGLRELLRTALLYRQ